MYDSFASLCFAFAAGLCCFTRTAEGAWEAQTYNITIFPEPTAWNPYFSVTASTLEFLSNEV